MDIITPQERIQARVEVEDDHLMLIFPKKIDDFMMRWEEAYALGDVLERAAEDIPNKPLIINPVAIEIEQAGIKLNKHRQGGKHYVVLILDHTDRVRLSYEAARIAGRAIKCYAQDLDFAKNKKVYIRYDCPGHEGRPMPYWDTTRMPKTIPAS